MGSDNWKLESKFYCQCVWEWGPFRVALLGVSCAVNTNSFGILGIIYVLTSSVSRLFSRNIGQLLSVAQILDLSLEKLLKVFVSLPLEFHYHWNPLLGTWLFRNVWNGIVAKGLATRSVHSDYQRFCDKVSVSC